MAESTSTSVRVQKERASGTAVTSAVFAVVAFTVGMFWNIPVGVVLAGIGLLFGLVAVYRSREGASVWVPALIVNGFTLLVGVLVFFLG